MVDIKALHGAIIAKGETQRSIAEKIGMPYSTFCTKIRRKSFNSDDMFALRRELGMSDSMAIEIFFADEVA